MTDLGRTAALTKVHDLEAATDDPQLEQTEAKMSRRDHDQ